MDQATSNGTPDSTPRAAAPPAGAAAAPRSVLAQEADRRTAVRALGAGFRAVHPSRGRQPAAEERVMEETRFARMQLDTLRLRLLKIGGRVWQRADHIRLRLASSHPGQPLWDQLAAHRRHRE